MSWTNENLYGKTTWYFYPVLCFLSSGLSLLHHFTSLLHILVQFATGVLQLYGVMAFSNVYHSTFELFNNFFETNTDKIMTVEIVQTLCFSLKFQLFLLLVGGVSVISSSWILWLKEWPWWRTPPACHWSQWQLWYAPPVYPAVTSCQQVSLISVSDLIW